MEGTTEAGAGDEPMVMRTICNGPGEGGGFSVAPQARPDDGIWHYAGIRKLSRLLMLRLIPEVMKGTHGKFKQTRMGTMKRMTLQSDRRLTIHADGEILPGFDMNVRNLSLELIPAALQMVR